MRRILTFVSCWVLALTVSSVASADLVANFWDNVEAASQQYGLGLKAGDSIRVVFITSALTLADKDKKQDYYNTFGDGQAASGLLTQTFMKGTLEDLQPLTGEDWVPLVTTKWDGAQAPVLARLKSSTRPVFNTNGDLVGFNGESMLGGLVNAIRYDQSGDLQASGPLAVWTGTGRTGEPIQVNGLPANPAGAPDLAVYQLGDPLNQSMVGNGGSAGTDWLGAVVLDREDKLTAVDGYTTSPFGGEVARSIYVMSGEITVVPEPSTILLWLGMAGIAGVVFWRKRRS